MTDLALLSPLCPPRHHTRSPYEPSLFPSKSQDKVKQGRELDLNGGLVQNKHSYLLCWTGTFTHSIQDSFSCHSESLCNSLRGHLRSPKDFIGGNNSASICSNEVIPRNTQELIHHGGAPLSNNVKLWFGETAAEAHIHNALMFPRG